MLALQFLHIVSNENQLGYPQSWGNDFNFHDIAEKQLNLMPFNVVHAKENIKDKSNSMPIIFD